jgi:hypothetical protein
MFFVCTLFTHTFSTFPHVQAVQVHQDETTGEHHIVDLDEEWIQHTLRELERGSQGSGLYSDPNIIGTQQHPQQAQHEQQQQQQQPPTEPVIQEINVWDDLGHIRLEDMEDIDVEDLPVNKNDNTGIEVTEVFETFETFEPIDEEVDHMEKPTTTESATVPAGLHTIPELPPIVDAIPAESVSGENEHGSIVPEATIPITVESVPAVDVDTSFTTTVTHQQVPEKGDQNTGIDLLGENLSRLQRRAEENTQEQVNPAHNIANSIIAASYVDPHVLPGTYGTTDSGARTHANGVGLYANKGPEIHKDLSADIHINTHINTQIDTPTDAHADMHATTHANVNAHAIPSSDTNANTRIDVNIDPYIDTHVDTRSTITPTITIPTTAGATAVGAATAGANAEANVGAGFSSSEILADLMRFQTDLQQAQLTIRELTYTVETLTEDKALLRKALDETLENYMAATRNASMTATQLRLAQNSVQTLTLSVESCHLRADLKFQQCEDRHFQIRSRLQSCSIMLEQQLNDKNAAQTCTPSAHTDTRTDMHADPHTEFGHMQTLLQPGIPEPMQDLLSASKAVDDMVQRLDQQHAHSDNELPHASTHHPDPQPTHTQTQSHSHTPKNMIDNGVHIADDDGSDNKAAEDAYTHIDYINKHILSKHTISHKPPGSASSADKQRQTDGSTDSTNNNNNNNNNNNPKADDGGVVHDNSHSFSISSLFTSVFTVLFRYGTRTVLDPLLARYYSEEYDESYLVTLFEAVYDVYAYLNERLYHVVTYYDSEDALVRLKLGTQELGSQLVSGLNRLSEWIADPLAAATHTYVANPYTSMTVDQVEKAVSMVCRVLVFAFAGLVPLGLLARGRSLLTLIKGLLSMVLLVVLSPILIVAYVLNVLFDTLMWLLGRSKPSKNTIKSSSSAKPTKRVKKALTSTSEDYTTNVDVSSTAQSNDNNGGMSVHSQPAPQQQYNQHQQQSHYPQQYPYYAGAGSSASVGSSAADERNRSSSFSNMMMRQAMPPQQQQQQKQERISA